MRKLAALLFALLLASPVYAQHIDTYDTVPSSNSSFITDLQTFLEQEDAIRFQEAGFTSFVSSGGTHATGAGLTKAPDALTAYPGGYRITETGSITYPASDTCWVIADVNVVGDSGTYSRVTGTHYLLDCASASLPSLPANSVQLMEVTTDGSGVTAVTDLRVLAILGATAGGTGITSYTIGDLLYADTTTTLAKLADVATGNVLISGGVGVAPSYGKVDLTAHVSGVLPSANGGTGIAYFTAAGPSTGRTYTFSDANSTVLDSNRTRLRSKWWDAQDLTADETQCAIATLAVINSGPSVYSIICTDNDASTIYGKMIMPTNWDAGTITLTLAYVQTAADTNALASDVTAMCRAAGATINNTWGTEVALDDAAVTGSNAVDMTTTAAITPNGTCAAGDLLIWRWQMDAGGTTTAVATLHILGAKMFYTVTGFSDE